MTLLQRRTRARPGKSEPSRLYQQISRPVPREQPFHTSGYPPHRPQPLARPGKESMVTTAQFPQPQQHLLVLDGEVQIINFIETDPYVYRVLADADDPEEVTHAILRIGAQATLIAGADLEAQVIERRFEGLARTFDASLGSAVPR